MSYLELFGVLFGLVSVLLAARLNVLTWPTGLVNVSLLFVLFHQARLYADMGLQVFFFITSIYGWHYWNRTGGREMVTVLTTRSRSVILVGIVVATIATGAMIARVHLLLPAVFPERAAYPFLDSFILVASMQATVLMAHRKLESWALWIVVDLCSVLLFHFKDLKLLTLEYLLFLGLAIYGLNHWHREHKHG